MQVELKKQQKFYELEKENLIRKSQQYEDLSQEYRSLKLIYENLKAKTYEPKSVSNHLRNTYQPDKNHQKKKTLVITKPVLFQENLFSKNLFTKSHASMDFNEDEQEIKMLIFKLQFHHLENNNF